MNVLERLREIRERLGGSLWFLPTVAVVAATVLGLVLVRYQVAEQGAPSRFLFGGGSEGARAVLQVIAGSVMTVVSVSFSLVVVALTNASNQYSPRLLSTFLRDRSQQSVLAIFLATFAYSIVVLRTISGGDAAVPRLAVTIAVVLGFTSLGALVHFIHHITQSLRVEAILNEVAGDTAAAIDRLLPRDSTTSPGSFPRQPPAALPLLATSSGFVQAHYCRRLARRAAELDVHVRYQHQPGEHVTKGTVVAHVWPAPADVESFAAAVNRGLVLGSERALGHDVAFGIRQLADIALRALSPGVNDPTTAADTLARSTPLVGTLAGLPLGSWVEKDDDGHPRVLVPGRTFAEYLEILVPQVLIYGEKDPTTLSAVAVMLRDVGVLCRDDGRRETVVGYVRACAEVAQRSLTVPAARSMTARSVSDALAVLHRMPDASPDG